MFSKIRRIYGFMVNISNYGFVAADYWDAHCVANSIKDILQVRSCRTTRKKPCDLDVNSVFQIHDMSGAGNRPLHNPCIPTCSIPVA